MASALLGVHTGSTAHQLLLFRVPALRSYLHSSGSGAATAVVVPSTRLKAAALRVAFAHRSAAAAVAAASTRNFYTSRDVRHWRNESPPGGLTVLHVFHPTTSRVWPDPVLGVFSATDPRCCLPGNVGLNQALLNQTKSRPSNPSNGMTSALHSSFSHYYVNLSLDKEIATHIVA